ncbi:MAG: hypothetical protein IPI73_19215 [Betaproteobacteria bacterium]|nr:hypothetical protein [Betaproteobacteria bacterium]
MLTRIGAACAAAALPVLLAGCGSKGELMLPVPAKAAAPAAAATARPVPAAPPAMPAAPAAPSPATKP